MPAHRLKHGSLFSGIGGFDLAAEWMGWENIFHCEWNEFGQRILKHHWPNAISYGDITKTDFTIHRGGINILTGGFPCQPYSCAGKRKGNKDQRHLWPEMLRAIREIQPGFIVGENVSGLISWNGGMVFEEVQSDLENEGYEVFSFVLPACAKNAPHRRDRIWFIAKRKGMDLLNEGGAIITNTKYQRFEKQRFTDTFTSNPTVPSSGGRVESGFRGGNDGIPSRVDRLEALGNAIVPQVAFEIFKAIEKTISLR